MPDQIFGVDEIEGLCLVEIKLFCPPESHHLFPFIAETKVLRGVGSRFLHQNFSVPLVDREKKPNGSNIFQIVTMLCDYISYDLMLPVLAPSYVDFLAPSLTVRKSKSGTNRDKAG